MKTRIKRLLYLDRYRDWCNIIELNIRTEILKIQKNYFTLIRNEHKDYLRLSVAYLHSLRLHQFQVQGRKRDGGYAMRERKKKCTAMIFRNAMSTIRETPSSRRVRARAQARDSRLRAPKMVLLHHISFLK